MLRLCCDSRMLQEPARCQLDIKASDIHWERGRAFAMGEAEIAAVIPRLQEFMFHPRPASAELADADTECLLAFRAMALVGSQTD